VSALSSLNVPRAQSPAIKGFNGKLSLMRSQKARRRTILSFSGEPAIMAPLMAPIEMPAIQCGR
jgi:hypothetical protein